MRFIIKYMWNIWLIFQLVNGEEFSCPEMCTCYTYDLTTCQHKGLTNLPHGLYSQISRLDLSFNEFSKIPLNISRYKTLHYLNMSHNKLSYIEDRSLQTLDSLEILDLSHNLFKDWLDINKAALINLPSLTELNLSHNPLQGFSDIFINQPLRSKSLQTLLLINCSITNILDDIIIGFSNLKTLILSNNPLLAFTARLKSNTLQHLDLSNCSLHRIHPDGIFQLQALESLSLIQNYQLKKFTSKSTTLKYLDLSHCNLDNIPTSSLPNLTTLILKGNHLRHIPANTFISCPAIQNVDLSSNTIKKIDVYAFSGLKYLHSIDLSFNTIRDLSNEVFIENKQLTKLNLSRNYLNAVGQLSSQSLKLLDISVCEIREIGASSLIQMPKLHTLNLSRNFIPYLPNKLRADELRVLDLSMCGIFSLNNSTFSVMHRLRSLNLAGNRLSSGLKPSYFNRVTQLNLEDNSWLCDCKSDEFLELYVWLHYTITTKNNLRCRSPENIAGLTWETACESIWLSSEVVKGKGAWVYSLSVVALMTLLCCLVVSLRHIHRRKVTREQELQEIEREEARERLRQIHQRNLQYSRESINRNAPDPREMQTPPSYMEAISMPRLNISCSSLAGSHRSLHSLQSNHTENSRRTKLRRKRPRNRQGSKCNISETQSTASFSHGNTEVSNSEDELHPSARENNAVIESSL